ncbi:sensor domain-containing diguanylate cyclase [Desulfatibacillum alkenivorans]|nr:diguanylate cyclase [Desulfatibacillum alkenivorans]
MKRLYQNTILLLFLLWVMAGFVIGAEPVVMEGKRLYAATGSHSEYLLASSEDLGIEDILQKKYQDQFQPHKKDAFTLGLTSKILWLRFKLVNRPETPLVFAVDRPFPYVDLYSPQKSRAGVAYDVQHSGYLSGERKREAALNFRFPTFHIPKDAPGDEYFYLRLKPFSKEINSSLSFLPFVEEREDFIKRTWREISFFFIVCGMLLSLAFYNLFLAIQLKDRVYFAYVGYVVFILIYVLTRSGLPAAFGAPRLNLLSIQAVAIALCFSILFAKSFLQTKEHCPVLHHLLTACFILCLAVLAAMITGHPKLGNTLVHGVGAIGVWLAIITGVRRLLQGYVPARYYVAGWLTISLGSFMVSLQGFGLLPNNFATTNAVAITCTMETVLLSLALGDRINALQQEKRVLKVQEKRLMELSIRDELTGLFNKRWFSTKISSEIGNCRAVNQPLSLIILDIDHFKRLNDTYGHAMGDTVLNQLGKIISVNVRDRDVPCRYGGEEFTIILPLIDLKKAAQIAERLRGVFSRFVFQTGSGEKIKATISLGAAELSPTDDAASLFEKADQALYRAKNSGRNKVISAPEK